MLALERPHKTTAQPPIMPRADGKAPAIAQLNVGGGPAAAVRLAVADANRLPPKLAKYMRYGLLAHLPPGSRQAWWQAASGQSNGMSFNNRIIPLTVILDDGTVLLGTNVKKEDWGRVLMVRWNLLDYDPELKVWPVVWEKLPSPHFMTLVAKTFLVRDPKATQEYGYFVSKATGRFVHIDYQKGKDDPLLRWVVVERRPITTKVRKIRVASFQAPWLPEKKLLVLTRLTGSQVPVVYADWWLWQVGIQNNRDPAGYYDFNDIKDEETFHLRCGLDRKEFEKKFKAFLREVRAAQATSDVLRHGRVFFRLTSLGGSVWGSLDNKVAINRFIRNKGDFRDPVQVLDKKLFKNDGTEQFGHNACGWWLTYAGNGDGQRLNGAPDFLGYDKLTNHNTSIIEVNVSCLRCHTDGGLKDLKPYHQDLYSDPRIRLLSPDYGKLQEATDQYFTDLKPFLTLDRARYEIAVKQATGLTASEYAKVLGDCFAEYDADVTFERACRDLGSTLEEMDPAIQAYLTQPTGDQALANWLRPKEKQVHIDVFNWHSYFPVAMLALESYRAGKRAGYKVPNILTPECQAWTRKRGRPPAFQKGEKLLSWYEMVKECEFDWSKWVMPPRQGPDPLKKVESELEGKK